MDSCYTSYDIASTLKLKDQCCFSTKNLLSACVERHAPLIKIGRKHFKLVKNRWVSAKIQKMILHRDSLYDKWNKNRNDKITEKYYKKVRNCLVYEIRKYKSEYFKNYFDQHKTSIKKKSSQV